MFIGHYAPAFAMAANRKAPGLAVSAIAVQLIDIAFFSFALLGIENFRLVPGATATNWLDLYDMPWTHSLLGTLGWAALLGGLVWVVTRQSATALIAAGLTVSHWLLDLLVHRPDLTLAGQPPLLGLGLWNLPLVEKPLELALTFGTLAWYARHTRATGRTAPIALTVLTLILLATQAIDWFGPRTTVVTSAQPLTALAAYGVIAGLCFWVQRTRKSATEA